MQLDNIVDRGSWCISSAELDHGVGMIIDGNINTYWQSKGELPHTIEVHFSKKEIISSIGIYMCYTADTTYSPLLISILYGDDGVHYQEFKTCTIKEINGWFTIDTIKENRPLTAFSLQFVIHEMHHNGKNTRIRQIRILAPHIFSETRKSHTEASDELLFQFQSTR